ncbi:hypothetical protein HYFRA_00011554 [Hymenoscyphus fraxineus]|uniref:NAD(P)-binding protein n=1 Tax=Hymenoscyphus fraxineus TaxID=746836 RepID=A0A9N9L720_9HELO|nr:hypothetical protein HYFRA_00011554 [Hymenoscyphus fraxineus]
MSSDIKRKVVVVELGNRAAAIKLHSLGAILAITDRDIFGTQETHSLCGGKPHYWGVLDVTNKDDISIRIAEIVSRFGHIDHVFNCAGINPTTYALTDTSDGYFDSLMNVNVKGVYNITKGQATIPYMASGGGSYVNVSSICGLRPKNGFAIYCATKYAIIGFSKSMALELGPRGIRTNVVAPGYIDTPTNAAVVEGKEAVKAMVDATSLGRMGTAEEVADVVVFLMSKEARYMNGSVVEIDGGVKLI